METVRGHRRTEPSKLWGVAIIASLAFTAVGAVMFLAAITLDIDSDSKSELVSYAITIWAACVPAFLIATGV